MHVVSPAFGRPRFYEPVSGSILLDGRPLGDYDKRWRHRVVSMVGQEPVLFARSIRENIQYGMEEEDVSFDRYRCGWAWVWEVG